VCLCGYGIPQPIGFGGECSLTSEQCNRHEDVTGLAAVVTIAVGPGDSAKGPAALTTAGPDSKFS